MNMGQQSLFLVAAVAILASGSHGAKLKYYGTPVGAFPARAHEVSGTVYIVNSDTLFIKNFNYDGQGPDAFFWYGTSGSVGPGGKLIPDEKGSTDKLRAYRGEDLILKMPGSAKVWDIMWLSVWCRSVGVDFSSFDLPLRFRIPWTQNLGCFLPSKKHGVSSDMIYVRDSRTLEVKLFNYDGKAPDTFFLAGKGADVKYDDDTSLIIPNEVGSKEPLGEYKMKTLILRAPSGTNLADYSWLSVYCKSVSVNFAHVKIPSTMVVPPNLDDLRGENLGFLLGSLEDGKEGVTGTLYVIDDKRLYLKGFSFNGLAPDTYFYFDTKGSPNGNVYHQIANEHGSLGALGKYENADLILTLPDGFTTDQIKWFSVWCKQVVVDLGHVIVNVDIRPPQTCGIGTITHRGHGVHSGQVTLLDTRRIQIVDFRYEPGAPDTFFILGKGSDVKYDATTTVQMMDETGLVQNLKGYTGKTIIITAPEGVDVSTYDWLSVYCVSVSENFGDVRIPRTCNNLPPSVLDLTGGELPQLANCEGLHDKLNVHWEVKGDDIVIELEGVLDPGNGYMAFGLSGSDSSNSMAGADVTVTYFDGATPKAEDYFLSAYSSCSRGRGACPDNNNDVTVINGGRSNGIAKIRYMRKLRTGDSQDKEYPTRSQRAVVWALGQMTSVPRLVTKHHTHSHNDLLLNFGRSAERSCPVLNVGPTLPPLGVWPANTIDASVTTLNFKLGPAGGAQGYRGITGIVGWGIAYYVNDLLIPEITVKRGRTYTFNIETGDDDTRTAEYHPVYITTDAEGGWVNMDAAKRSGLRVFAGLTADGKPIPSAVGHLCEYDFKTSARPDSYPSFQAYFDTLELDCRSGDPGSFTWTPDSSTPDLVYYQCYQHRYLGWKIHVVD